MNWKLLTTRRSNPELSPAPVTAIQWLSAGATLLLAAVTMEVSTYRGLALVTQLCAVVSVVLLTSVAREALRSRVIGKCCLIVGVFVFYWVDAVALTLQPTLFSIPEGFPISATQFNQQLVRQAILYVAIFQMLLLIGYSIRPRFNKPIALIASRIDALSFDRSILGMMLLFCAVLPLFIYYKFDLDKVLAVLIDSRSIMDLDAPQPGLAQHLTTFGIYGASLFFVYAIKSSAWRRFWWLLLALIAAIPFLSSGTRHMWLYISLPSFLIVLRGSKRHSEKKYGVLALGAAVLLILLVAQFQFAYRSVGWRDVGHVPLELSELNSNGHFTALLFAEHLVPNEHSYFREPAEFYFLIHWIPRRLWPDKPIMESWVFYNDSYVRGAAYNVTPSVIGQFHMQWGVVGVIFIGGWLGFLTFTADRLLLMLDANRQKAIFVVVGMFYAFIISSFRFYSPIYFSYFVFGLIAMFLLTRRGRVAPRLILSHRQVPA